MSYFLVITYLNNDIYRKKIRYFKGINLKQTI